MLELIKTDDGSNTLYNKQLKEYYHSRFGAIAESKHVFIEAGLQYAMSQEAYSLNIFEVGFGTGLNAFLTFLSTTNLNTPVFYHTIEPFPLPDQIVEKLNYSQNIGSELEKEIFRKLHHSHWDQIVVISDHFHFLKQKIKLEEVELRPQYYHLVYFDAFAPDIQPELWTSDIFARIFKSLKVGGVVTTYSAKGKVRRNLQSVGFNVERIRGPKGKREMIRATKINV
jgi:tRNA U34 5-methylaminomethyl-2-thiouridine-forming methyltransferase MnmC